jgi:hypothetical protein
MQLGALLQVKPKCALSDSLTGADSRKLRYQTFSICVPADKSRFRGCSIGMRGSFERLT